MTELEFTKLFWKIARKMKYKKRVIDLAIVLEKDWLRWGMCSINEETKYGILYFKKLLLEEPRMFIIEVIIEELLHLEIQNHEIEFVNKLKFWFKRLKNL